MKLKSSSSKGFTLIELLVVVAIISLLSSIVLASLREAREKAKIVAFRTELGQFVNAMELYRVNNPDYPANFSFTMTVNGPGALIGTQKNSHDTLLLALSPYIPKIPVPPQGFVTYIRGSGQGKCKANNDVGSYLIRLPASVPGFEDWSTFQYYNGSWQDSTEKCFQI